MDNKHFFDFFKKYDDDFGYNETWNKEIDKWLALLHALNSKFYDLGKTRVGTQKQRDEFLGEAKSIYYCHEFLHGKNFKLEPSGKNNKKLDFFYERDDTVFLVEVKSPSWLGEVWKDTSIPSDQKKKRQQQPQYLNNEALSFTPRDAVEDSIKNALPKFEKNQENVLMITPNMFVAMHNSPNTYVHQIVSDELKKQDKERLISTIAILEAELPIDKQKVEYHYTTYSLLDRDN